MMLFEIFQNLFLWQNKDCETQYKHKHDQSEFFKEKQKNSQFYNEKTKKTANSAIFFADLSIGTQFFPLYHWIIRKRCSLIREWSASSGSRSSDKTGLLNHYNITKLQDGHQKRRAIATWPPARHCRDITGGLCVFFCSHLFCAGLHSLPVPS